MILHPERRKLLSSIAELRYQVYCLEFGYVPYQDCPDGGERDDFDSTAAHFCELDAEGSPVGYVRLVTATDGDAFPFEAHRRWDDALPPRPQCAEISRLILRQDHRRRRCDRPLASGRLPGQFGLVKQKVVSDPRWVLLRLYRQLYAYSVAQGVDYWFAAMERPLARSLSILNLGFRAVGPEFDYAGSVGLYVAEIAELERTLARRDPVLLEWLRRPPEMSPLLRDADDEVDFETGRQTAWCGEQKPMVC